ncbi:MAG: hypothetical protein II393_02700, partial [Cytophagales bacterium]|nr:hypothetical protein [Cytophagales bacterium]
MTYNNAEQKQKNIFSVNKLLLVTTVRINNCKKVSLVVLMCAIGSSHLGAESILDENGCPAKSIDMILNNRPARYFFEHVFLHYG